ncbi:MAG: DUF3362 domain-containing protein, partial [Candidatus Latescibacteria bacterium]|nr:DUF3362 domain-containing protein [Candidatus Latescibacterota bacterium]
MKPVKVARNPSDRAPQRALLQFFMPENYRSVRQSLEKIGREDLIGDGPECLIPENPPKGAYMKKGKAGGGAKGRNRGKGQGGYRWAARRDSNRD